MGELVSFTLTNNYDETEDVFNTLDKTLKMAVGGGSKDDDNAVVKEQVLKLLKETRVPVSQKDFIYHMNKIITIILGMMLHNGFLTFTKYHKMKCAHRADMEEMLDTSDSSLYEAKNDVFGVLDRAIEKDFAK